MRTIDEQMDIVILESEKIRKKKNRRKITLYNTLAVCAGLAVAVLAAVLVPAINGTVHFPEETIYGSLMLHSPYLGYIFVGVLAFLLGLLIALLCIHISRSQNK